MMTCRTLAFPSLKRSQSGFFLDGWKLVKFASNSTCVEFPAAFESRVDQAIGLFQPPPRMQSWGVFVGFASWEEGQESKTIGGGNSKTFFGIFTPIPGGNDPNLTFAYFSNGLVKNHQLEDIQGDLKLTTVTSSQDGSISEVLSESIGFSEEVVARTVFNLLGCRKNREKGNTVVLGAVLFWYIGVIYNLIWYRVIWYNIESNKTDSKTRLQVEFQLLLVLLYCHRHCLFPEVCLF